MHDGQPFVFGRREPAKHSLNPKLSLSPGGTGADLSAADVVGVEAEVHATSEYGTTYRVYVNFDAADEELVAIYGTVGESQNAP